MSKDSTVMQRLQKKKEEDLTTVNALVNYILKRCTESDMYIENKTGIIPTKASTYVIKN